MNQEALATRYRPKKFEEVCSQESIITILQNQLSSNTFKHSYLFTGPAGCGKTTCARIFANEINNGQGNPIEIDGASNSGVDNVRQIIKQAQTQSIDSEYKVFIIDECHAISSTGWQAFLKLIEEPPVKSIFIFCTTNPEKIPATILSRVQRYDFTRIPSNIIVDRLNYVIKQELGDVKVDKDILQFIAEKAEGGMRDALTYLDKALSYNQELTMKSVVDSLGLIEYKVLDKILRAYINKHTEDIIKIIDMIYQDGMDMKSFISQLLSFELEMIKSFNKVDTFLPKNILDNYDEKTYRIPIVNAMKKTLQLLNEIRYMNNCHQYIEAFMIEE